MGNIFINPAVHQYYLTEGQNHVSSQNKMFKLYYNILELILSKNNFTCMKVYFTNDFILSETEIITSCLCDEKLCNVIQLTVVGFDGGLSIKFWVGFLFYCPINSLRLSNQ